MDVDLPKEAIRDHWEAVVADLEATAAELESADWTAVVLHASDATTLTGDEAEDRGLEVLVPDDEFEALVAEIEAGATFAETVVYREAADGVVFLVLVFRDPERTEAVVVPAFYPQQGYDAHRLANTAHHDGEVRLHIRPRDRDRVVTFSIDQPGLVFPRTES